MNSAVRHPISRLTTRAACALLLAAGLAAPLAAVPRVDDPPSTDPETQQTKQDYLKMIEEMRKNAPPEPAPAPTPATPAVPAQPSSAPAKPPGASPAAAPAGLNGTTQPGTTFPGAPQAPLDPEKVRFDFSEPTDVQLVVKQIQQELGIQIIAADGGLAGQKVFFGEPITIDRKDLYKFLVFILEQKDYTIFQNAMGIYNIVPRSSLPPTFANKSELGTTRIIRVPGMKPSSLQASIQQVLGSGRAGAGGSQPVFLDDLGIILITDTPGNTQMVQDLVEVLSHEQQAQTYQKFRLLNVAATSARERLLELRGLTAQRTGPSPAQGTPGNVPNAALAGAASGSALANFNERLVIDTSENALIFRGRPDEMEIISQLLELIDVPNGLKAIWYGVGSSTAEAVANAGKREQLGEISSFETTSSSGSSRSGGNSGRITNTGQQPGAVANAFGQQQQDFAGSGFVLYPDAGGFMYRGTPQQHERVRALVAQLKDISERERLTLEFYKLKHGKSSDVAEVVQNLLSNSSGSGNRGGLFGRGLGGGGSGSGSRGTSPSSSRTGSSSSSSNSLSSTSGSGSGSRNPSSTGGSSRNGQPGGTGSGSGDTGLGAFDGEDVFVIADEPNNQIVVKAPAKLQAQFAELIAKIDLRRPQVYIDAKIVAVTTSDDFRLAVEVQQIIGQFAFNSNFGLGTLGTSTTTNGQTTTSGSLNSNKNVATNLPGFTAALIRSKDVPFVLTAMAQNTDSRIVASPQLLVDDNEEAEVSSLDQQATTTTSQSGAAGSTVTGFQGYESAVPRLKVTPQISEGGYMRLKYEIELSSFTGSSAGGIPPPKQENKIHADSVTVPSDSTIVVGGLTFDTTGKTVLKIPLLGDIPLVGNLFKDTSTSNKRTTLYIFITPKIMKDPSFADLRLITKAPLLLSQLMEEVPPPMPERIDVIDDARADSEKRQRKAIEDDKRRSSPDPRLKMPDPKRKIEE